MSPAQKPAADDRAQCTVVIATTAYRIEFITAGGRSWLRRFFRQPVRAAVLPKKLCRWLDGRKLPSPKQSLVVKRAGMRLSIRRYRPHPDDSVALLLEMTSAHQTAFSRGHGDLTRRENDVLRWIAAGKSNREMAEILNLSVGTVSKHLEHIFCKLGVENRTAAASFHNGGIAR